MRKLRNLRTKLVSGLWLHMVELQLANRLVFLLTPNKMLIAIFRFPVIYLSIFPCAIWATVVCFCKLICPLLVCCFVHFNAFFFHLVAVCCIELFRCFDPFIHLLALLDAFKADELHAPFVRYLNNEDDKSPPEFLTGLIACMLWVFLLWLWSSKSM